MNALRLRTLIGVGVVCALLAACSSDSGEGADDSPDTSAASSEVVQAGWVNETSLEPASGGVLEVTLPTRPPGLDPTVGTLGLPTQGPIFTALFDTLIRYDPDTGEFSGQLAEDLTHNDDFTEWTLTLRPGVEFTDGTPLDADAVVYNIDRLATARNASAAYPAYFASYEAVDDLTVVLRPAEPLNSVDGLFAAELGFVVSPTAVEALGDAFATAPVGAGPFMVESFEPDSELVLVKNPDYALGEVRLDGIRMTWGTDFAANVDKVLTGQSDMTFLGNSPQEVVRATSEGLPAYTTLVGGGGLAINNAAGRDFPGDDARIRQAISMAVEPELVNERVVDGVGVYGRFLYPPGNRYAVDTPYSLSGTDEARQLVEDVKADTGWDGSMAILTPPPDDRALALQAQLNAVGFDAVVEVAPDFSVLVDSVLVQRNFDTALWVVSMYDTNLYSSLSRSFASDSASNFSAVDSPELDVLIDELRATTSDEEDREVLTRMAELFQEEQPYFLFEGNPFSTVTAANVGGLVPTAIGVFLWSEVFKA